MSYTQKLQAEPMWPREIEKSGPGVKGISEEHLISGTDWHIETDEVDLKRDEEMKIKKKKKQERNGQIQSRPDQKYSCTGRAYLSDVCLR